jgi:hypothetical protein
VASTTALTPPEHRPAPSRSSFARTKSWSTSKLRLLVYSLLAFQVASALSVRDSLFPFLRSYWVITYDHGFVRRGLTGSALELVAGRPTTATIEIAAFTVAAFAVGALVVLIELLLRRRSSETAALAVLLACSPFTAEYLAFQRRPDVLAVPVLVGFGIALVRAPHRRRAWCVAAGMAFGVLALAHEAVVLQTLPWALVLAVALATGPRTGPNRGAVEVRDLAWLSVPAAAVFLVVARYGLPGHARVAQIRTDAARFHWPQDTSMLDVLGDSIGDSFARVRALPPGTLVATVLLGALLVGVHALWLSRSTHVAVLRVVLVARPHVVGVGSVAAVALGGVAMFATGIDWLRWIAGSALLWLLVSAIVALARDDSHQTRSEPPVVLSRWLVPAAIYLALLLPLGELVTAGQAAHIVLLGR